MMRDDEVFVAYAIARWCGGTFAPGENPPDIYLTIDSELVAVEISTLTQHVTDDLGTRPRLGDDLLAVRLANELNAELQNVVPYGCTIGLVLGSP
jgi:hypothetical protein